MTEANGMHHDWPKRMRAWAWSGVFAANLGLPVPFGVLVTQRGGWIGLVVAVVVCWAAGLYVCLQSIRVADVLIRGGAWVAVLQFIPVLQISAGLLSVLCWEQVVGSHPFSESGRRAEVGGFIVTLLTAASLLLMAFIFGGGIRLLFRPPAPEGDAAMDYAESRDLPRTNPEAGP